MCNEDWNRPTFLERVGRKVLLASLILAVVVLLAPALAGGAAGGALVGLGTLILKASWTA
jgi:hypothetical protein